LSSEPSSTTMISAGGYCWCTTLAIASSWKATCPKHGITTLMLGRAASAASPAGRGLGPPDVSALSASWVALRMALTETGAADEPGSPRSIPEGSSSISISSMTPNVVRKQRKQRRTEGFQPARAREPCRRCVAATPKMMELMNTASRDGMPALGPHAQRRSRKFAGGPLDIPRRVRAVPVTATGVMAGWGVDLIDRVQECGRVTSRVSHVLTHSHLEGSTHRDLGAGLGRVRAAHLHSRWSGRGAGALEDEDDVALERAHLAHRVDLLAVRLRVRARPGVCWPILSRHSPTESASAYVRVRG